MILTLLLEVLGIVKEMAGKWILGGVPPGPKKSGWVGMLDLPLPLGVLKKKPDSKPGLFLSKLM
jgi:hypothetical protein